MSNVQNLFSQPSFPLPYPGQSFFGSGNLQIYINSGTYVVPPGVTRIRVRVWGAGGSGGCTCEVAGAGLAAGGGGGGFGMKVIDTTPGTSYTVTVGAGGAPVTGAARTNGNAGGTSSFGTAVTCTGGGGGAANGGSAGTLTAAGGAGGTSTGGDVNYSGGAGGSCTNTGYDATINARRSLGAGGGSSGSIFGNGFAGGSISQASTTTTEMNFATGGGGVGGKGGNLTTTATFASNSVTGGGGTLSAAADITDLGFGQVGGGFNCAYFPVANAIGSAATISSATLNSFCAVPNDVFSLYAVNSQQAQLNQAVGSGGYSTNGNLVGSYPITAVRRFPGDILLSKAGPVSYTASSNILPLLDGCGGGGSDENRNQTSTVHKTAGAFGGGSGTADRGNSSVRGGDASIAGGGGGTCGRATPDAGTRSGAGGNGMVIVEW